MAKPEPAPSPLAIFSLRLRVLRALSGWTQSELAAAAGESSGRIQIQRWELGERSPRLESLLGLSEALGVTITRLIGIDPLPKVKMDDGALEAELWKESRPSPAGPVDPQLWTIRHTLWPEGVPPVQACAKRKLASSPGSRGPYGPCDACPHPLSPCTVGRVADSLLDLGAARRAGHRPETKNPDSR